MKSQFASTSGLYGLVVRALFCNFYFITASDVNISHPRSGFLDPRVIGGQTIGEYAIRHQLHFSNKGFIQCAATLVDVYAIQIAITATHCVWEGYPDSDSLIPAQNLVVTAGDRKISVRDSREQTRKVTKVVAYPGYDPQVFTHDISIMFLSSDFDTTEWVEPVLLPGYNWDEPKMVEVSGWGSLVYGGDLQDELRWVVLPVVDFATCQRFKKIRWTKITNNQMCVGELGAAKGTCSGDSGGPAVAFNETSGFFHLAGIVSFGITLVCGSPRYPVIYTRVSKYVDWIRIEVSRYKEELASGKR